MMFTNEVLATSGIIMLCMSCWKELIACLGCYCRELINVTTLEVVMNGTFHISTTTLAEPKDILSLIKLFLSECFQYILRLEIS